MLIICLCAIEQSIMRELLAVSCEKNICGTKCKNTKYMLKNTIINLL